jgi:hypothetical protein
MTATLTGCCRKTYANLRSAAIIRVLERNRTAERLYRRFGNGEPQAGASVRAARFIAPEPLERVLERLRRKAPAVVAYRYLDLAAG